MILWRREWQPTPVFLPGESHGQRSLAGHSPQGQKESDTTERLTVLLLWPEHQCPPQCPTSIDEVNSKWRNAPCANQKKVERPSSNYLTSPTTKGGRETKRNSSSQMALSLVRTTQDVREKNTTQGAVFEQSKDFTLLALELSAMGSHPQLH